VCCPFVVPGVVNGFPVMRPPGDGAGQQRSMGRSSSGGRHSAPGHLDIANEISYSRTGLLAPAQSKKTPRDRAGDQPVPESVRMGIDVLEVGLAGRVTKQVQHLDDFDAP
jgi:hypothetical protein